MAKIPYYFETPVPKYFRENGWFESEHMFKFVVWAFSKCQSVPHTENRYGRDIHLAPFEFIAGRLSSPKECFLSENTFRAQIRQLVENGILVKTDNSLKNKYTCYRWVVEKLNGQQKITNCSEVAVSIIDQQNNQQFSEENGVENNQQNNQQITNRKPTDNHKSEDKKIRSKRKDHPSIPSYDSRTTDDFSFEKEKIEIVAGVSLTQEDLDFCLKIKGDIEKVRNAIEFIQNSKKRKHPIADWPNALMKWKIENKSQTKVQDHLAYTEKLCKEFENHDDGRGWRCYMYHDRKKDQRGILFEPQSSYQEAYFVALVDGELKEKCENFINMKKMRKK